MLVRSSSCGNEQEFYNQIVSWLVIFIYFLYKAQSISIHASIGRGRDGENNGKVKKNICASASGFEPLTSNL